MPYLSVYPLLALGSGPLLEVPVATTPSRTTGPVMVSLSLTTRGYGVVSMARMARPLLKSMV